MSIWMRPLASSNTPGGDRHLVAELAGTTFGDGAPVGAGHQSGEGHGQRGFDHGGGEVMVTGA